MTTAPTHEAPHGGQGFNLAEHGWVPFRGGPDLSLREVLERAHELHGWPGGDPLAVSAVMRLMTALAYRCAGITDSETFKDAASRDRLFDPEAVDAYFRKHYNRFWLLPPEGSGHRPFYQDPDLAQLEPKPIQQSRLSMDVAPSYVWGQQHPDSAFTPPAAARAMLVFLLAGPGGAGASHPALPKTKWQTGHMRGNVSIHPVGDSLEDTLRLHLIDPEPVSSLLCCGVGSPSWEQDPSPVTRPLSAPKTILDQLTGRWTKTVLLIPSPDGRLVGGAATASGRRRGEQLIEHDPYEVRWDARPTKTGRAPRRPYFSLSGSAERSPWRDLDNYRAQREGSGNQTLVTRYHPDHPAARRTKTWIAVSHCDNNAKDILKAVSLIPAPLIVDFDAGNRAAAMIDDAEVIARRLKGALRSLYKDIGHPTTKGGDASGFVNRQVPAYWDRMERLFAGTVAENHRRSEVVGTAQHVFDTAARSFGQRLAAYRRSADGADDLGPEPLAVTAARWRNTIRFPKPTKNKTPKDQR